MPVAAPLLIAGGSLASGLIGSSAAKSAASAQAAAGQNALSYQGKIYGDIQDYYKPYMDIGKGATYTLGSMYGIGKDGATGGQQDFSQFYNSPDYEFARQQGQLGLDRYENSKGLALSGGALKDVAQFNQGLASQQFGNYFNRLLSLSQLGQQSASSLSNNAVSLGGQIGNTMQGIGQSQAAGIVGSANAITGGINSGIQNSLLYNAVNRSSYAPSSTPANIGYGSSANK